MNTAVNVFENQLIQTINDSHLPVSVVRVVLEKTLLMVKEQERTAISQESQQSQEETNNATNS